MNPARRLHNTLLDWRGAHSSVNQSVADTRDLDSTAGMERQLEALDDLRQIEAQLDVLEEQGVRVAVSRRYVSDWRAMALGFPSGWGQANPRALYNSAAIDQLETLADRLEERLPDLSDGEKNRLFDIASEAFDLLNADDTLSEPLRLYLARIIGEIQNAMMDEKFGRRFDYRAAAHRLWVTLRAAAEDSTDEQHKPKWRDTTRRFVWDASVSAIGNAPGLLVALTGLN